MLKAGSETNSLENHMMSRVKSPEPKVGMGATILMWTDRHACTIVKITPCQIHVQADSATRTDARGMSESQEYSYEPNPKAPIQIFRKTKRGWRDRDGSGLMVGARASYYDYSF